MTLRESGHSPTTAGTSVSHVVLAHVGWLISLVLVVVCMPTLPGFFKFLPLYSFFRNTIFQLAKSLWTAAFNCSSSDSFCGDGGLVVRPLPFFLGTRADFNGDKGLVCCFLFGGEGGGGGGGGDCLVGNGDGDGDAPVLGIAPSSSNAASSSKAAASSGAVLWWSWDGQARLGLGDLWVKKNEWE
jgi:hypothetical protein